MKITAFIIADKVTKSPTTQKLSIENIFNTINSKSFPAIHEQLSIITIFEGKDKIYNYKLTIKHDSDEKIIANNKINKKGGIEHTIVSVLNNIPLMKPGDYIFESKIDNQSIKKIIKVKKI